MRLHILSDLHLEFALAKIPSVEADVVVLAGDIHIGSEGRKWIRKQFRSTPVVYVLGNHEFYRHSLPELTETLKRETDGSHIHLLENNAVELSGVTFLGCTLWTDFELFGDPRIGMLAAEDIMSDFKLIRMDREQRHFKARDTVNLHRESVAWLKNALAQADLTRTVVITHHAPSPRSIPPYHRGSPLNSAFASNLDDLVAGSGAPLWVHGHTHYNIDYKLGRTRVLTNQKGYPDGVPIGYNPGLVVEI